MNNRNIQHAIRTINEKMSKLFYKNSIRFADQSNTWNLKCWKLCNFSAHTQYYRNLWQNDLQVSHSCAKNKENISKNDQLSTFFHNKLNYHSNDTCKKVSFNSYDFLCTKILA